MQHLLYGQVHFRHYRRNVELIWRWMLRNYHWVSKKMSFVFLFANNEFVILIISSDALDFPNCSFEVALCVLTKFLFIINLLTSTLSHLLSRPGKVDNFQWDDYFWFCHWEVIQYSNHPGICAHQPMPIKRWGNKAIIRRPLRAKSEKWHNNHGRLQHQSSYRRHKHNTK